jgi:hypothetical protein
MNNVMIGDEVLIDSFVTSKQRLRCVGRYRHIERERQSGHPQSDPASVSLVEAFYDRGADVNGFPANVILGDRQ